MVHAKGTTTFTLERAEALVLFEMLAHLDDQNCVPLHTPAEKLAMARLQGSLEHVLVEPFMPEYDSLVEEARSELMTQVGSAAHAGAA